jgi:nicotinamidase-related amidase
MLARFDPALEPAAGETVITKQYASAFFGTTLASTLTALGVDTLLIAGVSTSGCIRATALDACQHGFIPLVVRDAVGDRHPAPHEANLFDLQAKYAEVVSLETATRYLSGLPAVQCAPPGPTAPRGR